MRRLKSLLVAGAVAAAVASLLRGRFGDRGPVDPGGWKPVDPA